MGGLVNDIYCCCSSFDPSYCEILYIHGNDAMHLLLNDESVAKYQSKQNVIFVDYLYSIGWQDTVSVGISGESY